MRKEDLKAAFDKITPDEFAERRMLNNILSHSGKERNITMFNFRKAIPVLGLVVVILGSLLLYKILPNDNMLPPETDAQTELATREDMAAPLLNQFKIEDKNYIFMSDDLRNEYGLPAEITEDDIGDRITIITDSPDKSLIGKEVYRFIPAGSEAVVAVKNGEEYSLFKFFTFDSYNNNQDKDAIEYLKLYGINKAEDIEKVQFIIHTEKSKLEGKLNVTGEITKEDEIARFYDFYSKLKNSSDKYFEKLFNYRSEIKENQGVEIDSAVTEYKAPDAVLTPSEPENVVHPVAPDVVATPVAPYAVPEIAPEEAYDMPASISDQVVAEDLPLPAGSEADTPISSGASHGMMDMGDTSTSSGGTSVAPAQGTGTDALAEPVTIRIYNKHGVYLETWYYRNIGFISRYEVSQEFADFLNNYIG